MPELAEHKVVYVEKLNDAELEAKAKSAKAKAEHEMGFSDMASYIEKSIVSTIERIGLAGRATEDKEERKPAPKVRAEPKSSVSSKEESAEKKKRVKNWDIP